MTEPRVTSDDLARRIGRFVQVDRLPPPLVGPTGTSPTPGNGVGFKNPMTAAGDLIRGGTSGAATRLGIGTSGQVLTVVAGAPAWTTATSTAQFPYRWATTTTIADPGHGNVRANAAPPSAATALALSLYDETNAARPAIAQLAAGDELALYVAGDLSAWLKFQVTAAPVVTAASWLSAAVTLLAAGPTAFTPTTNAPIELALRTTGGAGGAYTDEQVRDVMATALVAGTGMAITANDPLDTITLALLRRYSVNVVLDGGGAALTTGIKGDLLLDTAGTIERWTLLADVSGSAVIDLWRDSYANFPPIAADSITAAAKPTLSSATKAQSSTLTGWTTSVSAGDVLRVNVDSVSTIGRLTVALTIREG